MEDCKLQGVLVRTAPNPANGFTLTLSRARAIAIRCFCPPDKNKQKALTKAPGAGFPDEACGVWRCLLQPPQLERGDRELFHHSLSSRQSQDLPSCTRTPHPAGVF